MIYCVVPKELTEELYPKLSSHYADEQNVTVIVERRSADRRAGVRGAADVGRQRRIIRDRRRARVCGELPPLVSIA